MIPNKLKLPLIVLSIILGGLLFYRCNKDPKPDMTDTKLTEADQAKVIVGKNKITVVTRNPDGTNNVSTKYVPEHATVVLKKNGDVVFDVKTFGFEAEPGIGAAGTTLGAALTLDLQFFYYKRTALTAGLGIQMASKPKVMPFAAVSYRLPWDVVSNTSLIAGYAPLQKSPVLGLRVRF